MFDTIKVENTESSIIENCSTILRGERDTFATDLSNGFKYSSRPEDNDKKLAELSGFSKEDPELSLFSTLMRAVKLSELYKESPAVILDPKRLIHWQRTLLLLKDLSTVAEDSLRIKLVTLFCKRNLELKTKSQGIGLNLEEDVDISFKKYLGI